MLERKLQCAASDSLRHPVESGDYSKDILLILKQGESTLPLFSFRLNVCSSI